MTKTLPINLTVNGEAISAQVPVRQNLVDFIRETVGLTGSHVGCEHGVCGACTLEVDGRTVRACLMLAVQADALAEPLVTRGASLTAAAVMRCGRLLRPATRFSVAIVRPVCWRRRWNTSTREAGPTAPPSESIFRAIIAAAPAISPSSTPSAMSLRGG